MEIGPGTVLGGKYRLIRPLARGGQGSVWVAHHLGLDVPIAIKFLTDTGPDSAKARSRFEREARAAATLRSPHVVQVLDYDANGEVPFIVMELLEGEDLRKRLARRGRLPLTELSALVTQLAKGLVLAHDAGIVHRDLKPGNVFIARVGADEIVKVLDFGVAKETVLDVAQTETTTGLVVGSPSYMSPEQARGGRVDGRSDLWSLAVVLFQALTGKRPFDGTNLGDLLVHICSEPIPLPTQFAADLPREVDAFMVRALSRNPNERFQNGTEFAEEFARVVRSTQPDARLLDAAAEHDTEAIAPHDRPRPHPETRPGTEGPPSKAGATRDSTPTRTQAEHAQAKPSLLEPGSFGGSGTQATASVDLASARRRSASGRVGRAFAIAGVAVAVVGAWWFWYLRPAGTEPGRRAATTAAAAPPPTGDASPATTEALAPLSADVSPLPPSPSVPLTAAASQAPSASMGAVAVRPPAVLPQRPWPGVAPTPPHVPPVEGGVDPKFGLPGVRH